MDAALCATPAELVLPLRQHDRQWTPCVDVGMHVDAGVPLAHAFGAGAPLCAPVAGRVHAIDARPVHADGTTAPCIVLTPDPQAAATAAATVTLRHDGRARAVRVAAGTPLSAVLDACAAQPDVVLYGDAVRGTAVADRALPLLADATLHLLDAAAFAALPAWLACGQCGAASAWDGGPLPVVCAACGIDAVRPGPSPALDALRAERRDRDAERLRLARADAARARHQQRNARLAAEAAARADRIVGRAGGADAVQAALARARAKRTGPAS